MKLSLNDVLNYALNNSLDTNDLMECKRLYRAHLLSEQTKSSESTARPYNRMTVSMFITYLGTQNTTNYKTLRISGLPNKKEQNLSLAFVTLKNMKQNSVNMNSVTVAFAPEMNLLAEINPSLPVPTLAEQAKASRIIINKK